MSLSLSDIHALHLSGQHEQAISEINTYLESHPAAAKAYQLKGNVFKAMSQYHDAQQSYLQALKLVPDDYETLNSLGNLFLEVGESSRAKTAYRSSLELNKDYIATQQNLAFLELKTSNPKEAARLFGKLVRRDPKNETYTLGYIQALKNSEKLEDALEEALKLDSKTQPSKIDWLKAQIYFELGMFEKSLSKCSELLESKNHFENAIELTSQIYRTTGQWGKAKIFTDQILNDTSIPFGKYSKCAEIFLQAGDELEAKNIISQAEDNNDKDAQTKAVKSQIYFQNGEYSKAYDKSLEALQLDPTDLSIKRKFALTALANDKPNDAIAIARTALALNKTDQFWISILAIAAKLSGQDHTYFYDYEKFVRVYDLKPTKEFSSISEFNVRLKESLNALHKFKKAPLDQSVRGGIQTSPNLVHHEQETIQLFFKLIDPYIKDYLHHIGFDAQHPFLQRNKQQYRLHSAWSVSLNSGGHHENHVHPEGWISSSYYVDTPDVSEGDPEQKGWIKFGEPSFSHKNLKPELSIAPRPGRLVLFPSYMWHGTVPTSSEAPRLTLPFDLIPD